ncbi:hypothetical protein BKA66DRAFT_607264 [Pyrenochaeta sp. MPI-SDFR-AT-0127]|nr:hypothetical protein BKA66DRAFT_607264 [Pyrenochaeta sp. MPI-SDFR-AT-0127]
MASKEEFEDLKDRNPIAKWLHDRARQTLAEATKTATATTAAATTATPTPISITLTEGADVVDPNSEPTLNSIVGKLLNPRSSGFYMGPRSYKPGNGIVCFTSEWVVRIIGLQHFKLELKNSRFIVKDNSKLKIHGLQAGLPKGLHSWLVGDGDEEQDPDEPPLFFESYYMTMNTLIEVCSA